MSTRSARLLGCSQLSIQYAEASVFPGIKGLKLEGDHSSPSSVEFKKAWSRTSTLPYTVSVWCLVNDRDDFTIKSVIAYYET